MKCLVTGGAGFIGSHLVDRLVEDEDKQVRVYDNYSTGKKENHNEKAEYVQGDVANMWIDKYDVIFHLAGEARIQPSFENPFLTHYSNVTGTARVLEIARKNGGRVIYAGSSSVYHDIFANPYSFTKMMAENYCTLYNKVYDIPVAIARFFNVYGPRQMEEGAYATVVGVFERQKREGKNLTVTGDGEKRRDFTHVDDIVRGLIAMSEKDWNAEVFNLGTGTNYSINEVAEMFGQPIEYIPERPGEAHTTLADIHNSKAMLGWRPWICLKEYINGLLVAK